MTITVTNVTMLPLLTWKLAQKWQLSHVA